MKNTKKIREDSQSGTAKGAANKSHELKTDFPLSEKDEVKQAEEKLRKATKGK